MLWSAGTPGSQPQCVRLTMVQMLSEERKPLALDGRHWIGHTIKNTPFTGLVLYCIIINFEPQIFLHLCDLSGWMWSRRNHAHNHEMNRILWHSWVQIPFMFWKYSTFFNKQKNRQMININILMKNCHILWMCRKKIVCIALQWTFFQCKMGKSERHFNWHTELWINAI